MFLVIFLALLIIWPIAEIAVMVVVAQQTDVFWMLFLLFASAVAGILVMQRRSRVHWERLRGAVSQRKPPAREAFDGVMITSGAILLIIPGFIGSALGLLLLLPPTRWLIRVTAFFLFASRFRAVTTAGTFGSAAYRTYHGTGRKPDFDVEGEAVDVTDRPVGDDSGARRLPSGSDDHSD